MDKRSFFASRDECRRVFLSLEIDDLDRGDDSLGLDNKEGQRVSGVRQVGLKEDHFVTFILLLLLELSNVNAITDASDRLSQP